MIMLWMLCGLWGCGEPDCERPWVKDRPGVCVYEEPAPHFATLTPEAFEEAYAEQLCEARYACDGLPCAEPAPPDHQGCAFDADAAWSCLEDDWVCQPWGVQVSLMCDAVFDCSGI